MITFKYVFFIIFGSIVLKNTLAVPPDECFASFRWDDCGQPPKAVMYYWKPGSRCEVGIWKGCLPNVNMFPDEYACIRTCIFADRAEPDDYHALHRSDEPIEETMALNSTGTNKTEAVTGESSPAGNGTTQAGESPSVSPIEGGDATTGSPTEGGDATTGSPTEGGDTTTGSPTEGGDTTTGSPTEAGETTTESTTTTVTTTVPTTVAES